MQYKIFICYLLVLIPGILIGQDPKEIRSESEMLADPGKYPVSLYLKLGLPFGAMALNTGNQNIRQQFEAEGMDLSGRRASSIFEFGMRYKRIYLEFGLDNPVYDVFNDADPVGTFTANTFHTAAWGNVGISILQNRNDAFLLRLGLGEFEVAHEISSFRNTGQLDFDELFPNGSSPTTTRIFHRSTFLDVGVEYWVGVAKSPTSFGQSLRFGYRFGLAEKSWEASGRTSVNAPMDRMGEFYFQFAFPLGFNFPQKIK